MRECRTSARLKVPPIQGLELDGGHQPCAVRIPSPDSTPPPRRSTGPWLGLLPTQRDIPQHQMAGICVQLSGQLRQKKITVCPIVQMSSLACPECLR